MLTVEILATDKRTAHQCIQLHS